MPNATKRGIVIAIDGPAGAGKSTIAQAVARRLGFTYLDTGAMYRAVTLKALEQRCDLKDEKALVALATRSRIEMIPADDHSLRVLLDGRDVTDAIRTPEVTNSVFFIARIPRLRAVMVKLQRSFGSKNNIVVEGRDTTTVVFPKAFKKFYLDADFRERIRRRQKDFRKQDRCLTDAQVRQDLLTRDNADMTRSVGALKKAKDAIAIDSTRLSIDEVVERIISYISNE